MLINFYHVIYFDAKNERQASAWKGILKLTVRLLSTYSSHIESWHHKREMCHKQYINFSCMPFINKENGWNGMMRWDFKTLIKMDENYPYLPWQSVNNRKKHVRRVCLLVFTQCVAFYFTSFFRLFTDSQRK